MEDNGVSSAWGKYVGNMKRASEELKGWTSRVEDLLDGGYVDGAVKLLKKETEERQTPEKLPPGLLRTMIAQAKVSSREVWTEAL
ncbi:hypothetical protein R1flu_027870 [Riccia fluitans]|uniref:Uncharacterized protein n=1 Tax=Riccia fluitans TaxID=41844 RepID=A0ABD1XK36_9MARC